MKTLYAKQRTSVDFLKDALLQHKGALDSSGTGVGKTVISCRAALELGMPVAIVCPKIVIPQWKRELAELGIEPVFVTNYEKLKRGGPHLAKVGKKLFRWVLPENTLIIWDEIHKCLPGDAKVLRPDGRVTPIKDLNAGDLVSTPVGPRKVLRFFNTGKRDICLVHHKSGVLRSSYDHKLLTSEGWVEAQKITKRHTLLLQGVRDPDLKQQSVGMPPVLPRTKTGSGNERLPTVRGTIQPSSLPLESGYVLLTEVRPPVCFGTYDARASRETTKNDVWLNPDTSKFSTALGQYAGGGESYTSPRRSGKNSPQITRCPEAPLERGEWDWDYTTPKVLIGGATRRVGTGIRCMGGWESVSGVAYNARRPSITREKMGCGSGRTVPQHNKSKTSGRKEGPYVARSWMESVSGYQQRCPTGCQSVYLEHSEVLRVELTEESEECFDIEVEDVHCFVADGVVVHNCKSPFSQNSQMLIAAKQAGYYNLMLSATACQDPTEMRSIGFALGLHSLNRAEGKLKSWFTWMLEHGCRKDHWNAWHAGSVAKLKEINAKMYGVTATRLTCEDLASEFAGNQIITEPLAFASLKDIAKFYAEHGITPEIVEQFLENGGASPHVLVEMLRARQLAEAAKVPDIIDMVWEARAEGFSVAVFVNFVDTVRALQESFGAKCAVVVGGQKDTEREENIQSFQRNEARVIVCNIAAGGTGVSLHDTVGGHPRMSLISPTFDEKAYVQTLGRIHRAGAKSPCVQRILVASGTIEEKILVKLEHKRLFRETLHTA